METFSDLADKWMREHLLQPADVDAKEAKEAKEVPCGDLYSLCSLNSPRAIHEPEAWLPEFERWLIDSCILRDDVGSGLSALHVSMSEWCVQHTSVPPTRAILTELLTSYGFTVADPLVWSLVLKCDLTAIQDAKGTSRLMAEVRQGTADRGRGGQNPWVSH